MSSAQMALEYLLVYCTSHGLTSIGEPPLPKTYRPVGDSLVQTQRSPNESTATKDAMPVWIIFIFLSLATVKYIASFLLWYVYQVISTVVIVASVRVKTIAAANAERHPESKRARMDSLIRALKVIRAFRSSKAQRMRSVSVGEVRDTLKRRATLKAEQVPAVEKSKIWKMWEEMTKLACFRGFSAYLMLAVCQWYIPVVIDFFLSGQPEGFKLGYGTTTIVLDSMFGAAFAVWTHYAITRPSQKRIWDHFPKSKNVLMELWDITASWKVAEHITMSCPLALSRSFNLKHYAFDAESWNTLDDFGLKKKIMEFGLVFMLYLLLVAFVAVPFTIITRRVYASMLSDDDLAIVPFHTGDRSRLHPYDARAQIRKPGLSISEAWSTVSLSDYSRVLLVYIQYFALNQMVQMAYWSANWKLHQVLEVDKFASTNLPCSPVGNILPLNARNTSGFGAHKGHLEL